MGNDPAVEGLLLRIVTVLVDKFNEVSITSVTVDAGTIFQGDRCAKRRREEHWEERPDGSGTYGIAIGVRSFPEDSVWIEYRYERMTIFETAVKGLAGTRVQICRAEIIPV
jgi:hypothetical protein